MRMLPRGPKNSPTSPKGPAGSPPPVVFTEAREHQTTGFATRPAARARAPVTPSAHAATDRAIARSGAIKTYLPQWQQECLCWSPSRHPAGQARRSTTRHIACRSIGRPLAPPSGSAVPQRRSGPGRRAWDSHRNATGSWTLPATADTARQACRGHHAGRGRCPCAGRRTAACTAAWRREGSPRLAAWMFVGTSLAWCPRS